MVLLSEVGHDSNVERIEGKLLEIIQRPFKLETQIVQVTASIGMAFYPKDGHNADLLMKNADLAMYRAKAQGKNRVVVYSSE